MQYGDIIRHAYLGSITSQQWQTLSEVGTGTLVFQRTTHGARGSETLLNLYRMLANGEHEQVVDTGAYDYIDQVKLELEGQISSMFKYKGDIRSQSELEALTNLKVGYGYRIATAGDYEFIKIGDQTSSEVHLDVGDMLIVMEIGQDATWEDSKFNISEANIDQTTLLLKSMVFEASSVGTLTATSASQRYYPVQLYNDHLFVNVPWTEYSIGQTSDISQSGQEAKVWAGSTLNTRFNEYLPLAGGTITGNLGIGTNAILEQNNANLLGFSSGDIILGNSGRGITLESKNADLYHKINATSYKIWDANNLPLTDLILRDSTLDKYVLTKDLVPSLSGGMAVNVNIGTEQLPINSVYVTTGRFDDIRPATTGANIGGSGQNQAFDNAYINNVVEGGTALSVKYLAKAGGSMSNTDLVTNMNADLLDSKHLTDIMADVAKSNVATATNLKVVDEKGAMFTYRNTPTAAKVAGDVVRVEEIRGQSIVWNQLVDNNTESVTLPSGNKYLIVPGNTGGADYSSIQTSDGRAIRVTGGEDMLIDLTRMFGAGREPATVAEFRAMYPSVVPDNILPYDSGSVLNLTATGMKMTGRNQWDEQWQLGEIDNTGAVVSGNRVVSKDFIPVQGNTDYYFHQGTIATGLNIAPVWYDANKAFISGNTFVQNGVVKSPANARFLKFRMATVYGTTYHNDICINISDPTFNGQYKPYREDTIALNTTTIKGKRTGAINPQSEVIFPNGLCGVDDVHDVLRKKDTDVLFRTLADIGQNTYTKDGNNFYIGYSISGGNAPKVGSTLLISRVPAGVNNMAVIGSGQYNLIIFYTDGSYADAAAFKAAMDGVSLVYQFATPKHYILDEPLDLTAYSDALGTQTIVPSQTGMSEPTSAPIIADLKYGASAFDLMEAGGSYDEGTEEDVDELRLSPKVWSGKTLHDVFLTRDDYILNGLMNFDAGSMGEGLLTVYPHMQVGTETYGERELLVYGKIKEGRYDSTEHEWSMYYLEELYLGLHATAANSALLENHPASHFATAASVQYLVSNTHYYNGATDQGLVIDNHLYVGDPTAPSGDDDYDLIVRGVIYEGYDNSGNAISLANKYLTVSGYASTIADHESRLDTIEGWATNASFNTVSITSLTVTNTIVGNASTATKLATARSIWGQSFDGSAAISGAMTGVTGITGTGQTVASGSFLAFGVDTNVNKATVHGNLEVNNTLKIGNVSGETMSLSIWRDANNNNQFLGLQITGGDVYFSGDIQVEDKIVAYGNIESSYGYLKASTIYEGNTTLSNKYLTIDDNRWIISLQ